ncbi:MAG: winged helix-turn-helix domain-containing protein [Pyrinomonadaceae bacterium]
MLSFGEFTLCANENALHRNGQPIALTPKMFEILLVLVKNHGRVVQKETLLREVWPDSFVEEGNITFNVRQIRKALGDDAQSPLYIETIPRRGYRFIADVTDLSPLQSEPVPAHSPSRKRHWYPVAVLTALLVLGISLIEALTGTVSGRTAAPILSMPFSSESLSTDGAVYHTVISPDGKNLILIHRRAGKESIWLRQLETSQNIQIVPPSDNFYGGLAVSPDGNFIYFARGQRIVPRLDVFRMPIHGGVPQKVLEGTQGWISLSPDSKRISFVRCPYTISDHCSLFTADAADGGNEKKILTRPRPIRIGDNSFSPDGRQIAFAVGQSRTSSNEFRLISVDIETGAERELTSQKFFNIRYLTWLPDGSGLLVSALVLPDRIYRIWRISPAGGEAAMLTSDAVSYARINLDARGRLLVSTKIEPDFRLIRYSTDDAAAGGKPLVDASHVAFAPNGRIIISSSMTGNSDIWSIDASGGDQQQLTNDPRNDTAPIVSPDGRYIFFQSDRSGQFQIWRMNFDGSEQKQVTTQEGGPPLQASPDGKWLYYRSCFHGSLRRVSLIDGSEELVLEEPGKSIAISPDTLRAAVSDRINGSTELRIISLESKRTISKLVIPDTTAHLAHLAWAADGRNIAYVLADDRWENGRLWFQDPGGGPARSIADLSPGEKAEIATFALAPDGKSFGAVKGKWKHDAVLIRGLK